MLYTVHIVSVNWKATAIKKQKNKKQTRQDSQIKIKQIKKTKNHSQTFKT